MPDIVPHYSDVIIVNLGLLTVLDAERELLSWESKMKKESAWHIVKAAMLKCSGVGADSGGGLRFCNQIITRYLHSILIKHL